VLDQPLAGLPQARWATAPAHHQGPAEGRRRLERLPGPAQRGVEGVRDLTRSLGERGQQVVGVLEARPLGDLAGVGEQQAGRRPPSDHLQGVADVEQVGVRPVDGAVRAVGQPGRRERPEEHRVPDATACLLEVRLDEERELARAPRALARGGDQLRETTAGGRAPVREDRGGRPVHEDGVPRERPDVEPAHRRREVGRGHLAGLAQRTDRVVEPDARVPQRVPEPLRDPGDLLRRVRAPVVDQDQVQVRARAEVAAGQAPDGGECDPRRVHVRRRLHEEGAELLGRRLDQGRSAGDPRAARPRQRRGDGEEAVPEEAVPGERGTAVGGRDCLDHGHLPGAVSLSQ